MPPIETLLAESTPFEELLEMTERLQTIPYSAESITLWKSGCFHTLSLEEWNDYSAALKKSFGTPEPSVAPKPCFEMHLCRGNCGNPLHTESTIRLSKAVYNGELWGDLVEEIEKEEKMLKRALKKERRKALQLH